MSTSDRISVEDAELKILGSLAEAPKSFYDLTQREKIASSRTVLKALERLENFMQIEKGEPEARNRIPYRLTVFGLVRAFGVHDVRFNAPRAVECYRDMFPLIFGKWEFFKGEGLYLDIIGRFMATSHKNMGFIEFMMEDFDTDYRKEAEENISEYPEHVAFYKTAFQGEEYKKMLEDLKMEIEEDKKILTLSDEEYDKYKVERIKDNKEDYQNSALKLVDKITKETLFSTEWTERLRQQIQTEKRHSWFKTHYEAKVPTLKIYMKDSELRELTSNYIEDEIKKNKAHLEALEDLKEDWDALISGAVDI